MSTTYWGMGGKPRHETVVVPYDLLAVEGDDAFGGRYLRAIAAFHAAALGATCRRCRSADRAKHSIASASDVRFLYDRVEVTFAVERFSDDQEADVAASRDAITAALLDHSHVAVPNLCAEHAARVAAVWA